MGMSASQARYLGLVARMNNIEYQGQQINQERTVLSQQCTALYNSLLDMQVPTPPSTSDYTKVVYSGADGASTFTIGSVIPHNGTYSIDFQYSKTGHYVDDAGTAAATSVPAKLKLTPETSPITSVTNYYDTTSNVNLTNYTLPSNGDIDTIMAYAGQGGSSFSYTSFVDSYTVSNNTTPVTVGITYSAADTILQDRGNGGSSFTPTLSSTYYTKIDGKFVKIADPTLNEYSNLHIFEETTGAGYTGATGDYVLNSGAVLAHDSAVVGSQFYVIQNGKYVQIQNPTSSDYNNVAIFFATTSTLYAGMQSHTDVTKDAKLGTGTSMLPIKSGFGYQKVDLANGYYVIESGAFRSIKDSDFATDTSDTTSLFLLNNDGTYRFNPFNSQLLAKRSTAELVPDDASGEGVYPNAERTDLIGVVADKNCYTVKTAANLGLISSDSLVSYIEALRNAFPADTEGKTDDEVSELFGVYFSKDSDTGRNVPHFVYTNEVLSSIGDVTSAHYLTTYDYIANGKYTDIDHKDNCLLTFDAKGRITDVKIPVDYAADGSVATYKTVHLSAETTTDSAAYEEAYNQYEYAQLIYDKKQQDINRKTEIIQQEDRNLELKLTRLDNERKAIDTELEAVKKVIEDNIESSYKTFSG